MHKGMRGIGLTVAPEGRPDPTTAPEPERALRNPMENAKKADRASTAAQGESTNWRKGRTPWPSDITEEEPP